MNKSLISKALAKSRYQMALYPLKDIKDEEFLLLDDSYIDDPLELKLIEVFFKQYHNLLKLNKITGLNKSFFDKMKTGISILNSYRMKNSSKSNHYTRQLVSIIKKGFGSSLMKQIVQKSLPLINSNPLSTLIADYNGHSLNYCIISHSDIDRIWVADIPSVSKVIYFAPCGRVISQLRSYGVPDERIFLTGLPFPKKILGNENLDYLKEDLGQRLHYLDPKNRFWPLHGRNVKYFITEPNTVFKNNRPLNLTFVARADNENNSTGIDILASLNNRLKGKEIILNLIAGTNEAAFHLYDEKIKQSGLDPSMVRLVFDHDFNKYFEIFSDIIRLTDILWTSPSELSYYGGLGIPIIITPALTQTEYYNQKWLLDTQIGMMQKEPAQADKWLFDIIDSGILAEAAWGGFLKERKFGIYKIEEILRTGTMMRESSPLKR